ncbi:MAG: tetratricopeptide repeat protein, partial [Chloroflexi bacterium SZAS-1]|nr:tetratricopeptide repeat protein [Chloroflexi bacterium SZAS-1]
MSDAPNPNNAAAQAMAALLASDASPEEFTRRLLAINIEQARELDAELPALLRACAIPRQFDAEVLGALRAAPDEDDRNAVLLEQIKGFSFVKEYSSGGFVYHDNVRDLLLAEWQAAPVDEYAALLQRLAALYLRRGEDAGEAERYDDALTAFSAALELAPDNGKAYAGRGKVHYYLKDYQSAVADFRRAVDLQPEDGDNYLWYGATHYQLKDYAAA